MALVSMELTLYEWIRDGKKYGSHIYGHFPFDVCPGVSHCRAVQSFVVDNEIYSCSINPHPLREMKYMYGGSKTNLQIYNPSLLNGLLKPHRQWPTVRRDFRAK